MPFLFSSFFFLDFFLRPVCCHSGFATFVLPRLTAHEPLCALHSHVTASPD